jgi:hypothetical protein
LWAEWIAWTLEAHGHKTVLQKWDFAAGSNFILEMHKAAATANERSRCCHRTTRLRGSAERPEEFKQLALAVAA